MANIYILSVIIDNLGHWQKSRLINLLIIDKNSEIGFYCPILTFGLAVNLRIKNSKKTAFN